MAAGRGRGTVNEVIAKRKDGSTYRQGWRARFYTADGQRRSRTFKLKADGEYWLTQQMAKPTAAASGRLKFIDLVEHWPNTWNRGSLSPTTRARYLDVLRAHLGVNMHADGTVSPVPLAKRRHPWTGTFLLRRADDITRADVQRYLKELDASGTLAPASIKKVHTVLSAIFSAAVDGELLDRNPCHGALPRSKQQPLQVQRISADEIAALAAAMITPRDRLVVYFAAYTGCRAGEVWAMRVADLDLPANLVHVRRAVKDANGKLTIGAPKSGKPRDVPIPRFLTAMLLDYLARPFPGRDNPDGLLFPSRTGHLVRHNQWMARRWRQTLKRVLPHKVGLRFHDLRHNHASELVDANVNLALIQKRLGHSDIRTTQLYMHPGDEAARTVADTLDSLHAAGEHVTRLRPTTEAAA